MINAIIRLAMANRLMVLVAVFALAMTALVVAIRPS